MYTLKANKTYIFLYNMSSLIKPSHFHVGRSKAHSIFHINAILHKKLILPSDLILPSSALGELPESFINFFSFSVDTSVKIYFLKEGLIVLFWLKTGVNIIDLVKENERN